MSWPCSIAAFRYSTLYREGENTSRPMIYIRFERNLLPPLPDDLARVVTPAGKCRPMSLKLERCDTKDVRDRNGTTRDYYISLTRVYHRISMARRQFSLSHDWYVLHSLKAGSTANARAPSSAVYVAWNTAEFWELAVYKLLSVNAKQ